MEARSGIRLGMLALVLAASCGTRALTKDGGSADADGSSAGGATGIAPAGAGGVGPATGSGTGIAGQSGAAGAGPAGAGGPGGRGGFVGTGGTMGTGRGGIGGGAAGRGGAFGTGGIGGATGLGGTGGVGGIGGRGGFSDTGGSGPGGASGVSGRGGVGGTSGSGGRGGTSGTGGSGVSGTFGTGGGGIGGGGTGGGGGIGGMSGIGGTAGASGRGGMSGTGGGVCLTCRTTVLPLAARDLVYNTVRNELYASIAGDADVYPNRIVVIDPSTSSVVSTIPIGSNPRTLAVSDDGATLWVGIDGAHAFRKVTLGSTPVIGPLIHLPKAMPTTYYDATAMAVLPGATPSLAVALYDGYSGDVRVFDDGVSRGGSATNGLIAYSLAAGPPGLLFGAGSYGLLVLRVGASGIAQTTPFFNLLRGYSSSLVYTGGKVYAQTGDVIDVSNPSSPFWTASLGAQGPVALRDPQSLLMLTTTNSPTFPFTLRTDIRITGTGSMITQLGSVSVPTTVAPNGAYCRDLVYAGGDTVAFVAGDYSGYTASTRVAIIHDPAFGTPTGGSGGGGGTGGTGGLGGAGGMGGAPDPCPGCSFAAAPAYGLHMAADASRNLIYVAAHAQAVSHPSSIVTVDAATAAVTSIVPVGNDPQPLALSDDGSALWVGLAGDHRVRRMTPGTTPVPGPAYALPMLLTTNEPASPYAVVVLPGAPASIAVGVYGATVGGRGVFILDDGLLRANYVQPPEVPAYYLVNGPPGYLLGLGDYNNLVEFRLGSVGATYESYGGLITGGSFGLTYSAGYLYSSTGEVVDLHNPDDPVLNGRFAFSNCLLALRSASRVMMVCPTSEPTGPILYMLDPDTFTSVGSVTLPPSLQAASWVDFAYLGGDAVALLGDGMPLQIMHAPLIASPP